MTAPGDEAIGSYQRCSPARDAVGCAEAVVRILNVTPDAIGVDGYARFGREGGGSAGPRRAIRSGEEHVIIDQVEARDAFARFRDPHMRRAAAGNPERAPRIGMDTAR